MGKVAQTHVFKKHSDKNFDFVDYMERKGLKITLPSTETNPSQSGAAGTSSSGEGSKKLKGKASVKKLNVVTPKKPTTVEAPKKATTGSVEAPKKSTTRSAEAPRKPTTGSVEATKKSTTGSAEAPRKPTTGSAEAPRKSTTGSAEAPRKSITGSAEAPTREYSNPKKGTPGVTPGGFKANIRNISGYNGPENKDVVEYNDDSGDEDTSSKTKKHKIAVLEKKSGFQPDRHVVETDQVADDVKMQLDPKTKDQLKPEFEELRKWFLLGDKLVYASISQLTDPDATAVYRPCSILHVAEIQNSMIGSADTPQAATVVPYELEANAKKKFLNILTMKDLKAFIKKGGKFMVISGLHSMKAAKNIILSVGGDKDHDLYGSAVQLSKRHIKIVRGDTPENVMCKLSYLANEQNKTFAFETAFVEQVIHGRKQYSLLGSPARAMKGMSNTKVFQVRSKFIVFLD
ncbi:hypothetical protein R1sor_026028 [Riccia sorocarpa]|uniref:Uncharacterized protein n=1 Tax=Riccia sorocarpa TaxID=122646 RepID=A0ABD3GAA4_9MARC